MTVPVEQAPASAPIRTPIRTILREIGGYRLWVLAAGALSFITLVSGIGLIAMAAYLLSRSLLIASTTTAALTILGVRVFAVTRVVSRYCERYVGHLGTFRILTRIRVWTFRGLLPISPAGVQHRRAGDLLTAIIDDVDTLQDLYLRVLVPPVAAIATAGVATFVFGQFDPVLGLVLLGFLVLCGLVIPALTRTATRLPTRSLVALRADNRANAIEFVNGLADLVALGQTDRLQREFNSNESRQQVAETRLATVRGIALALGSITIGCAALSLLGIAIPIARSGSLDPLYLAVVPLAAMAAFEAVVPLTVLFEHLDRTSAAAARLLVLTTSQPSVTEPPEVVTPIAIETSSKFPAKGMAIEFRDVSATYTGMAQPALCRASFVIPDDGITAIVGQSGAGKSTILNILLRFIDYDTGSVTVAGKELSSIHSDEARSIISCVQQRDHLFDTTVRDNLLLADGNASDAELLAACAAAGFDRVLDSLPLGFDERVGENGNRLSGGERQRLMIARALLANAPILVLDEATEHLDRELAVQVMSGIRDWRRGRTTVLIVHDGAELAGIDRVVVLPSPKFS
jgi:ATP-binding cassette subfamily C protein CydC